MKVWPQRKAEHSLPRGVSLDELEKEVRAVPTEVAQYAPRRQVVDVDHAVAVITAFGDLPTREMDDTIFALEEELGVIKDEAQRVRNAYVEVTDRLRRHIEKQKAVHKIAKAAFAAMATQCAALEQPELPFSPSAAPAEEPAS